MAKSEDGMNDDWAYKQNIDADDARTKSYLSNVLGIDDDGESEISREVRALIERKTETKNLDYKETLNWDNASKAEKAGLIKDIIAMANTQDGGKIVIGVRDGDFEFIGVTEDDFKTLDQTKINDFLHKYTDPKITCQVYKIKIQEKFVAAIFVPEFNEIPIICKKDYTDNSRTILRKGGLYLRTAKATSEEISSSDEMREFLTRALLRKKEEMLNSISNIIKGRQTIKEIEDDSRGKYESEINSADEYFSKTIGDKLEEYGSWELIVYPTQYNEKRFKYQTDIIKAIDESKVDLAGWYFPHIDKKANNFGLGRQSHTISGKYVEGYRAYFSGLFMWRRVIWEDIKYKTISDMRIFYLEYAIKMVTEFFIFIKRYFGKIISNDDILHISVNLYKMKDRKLCSTNPSIDIMDHICKEENIKIEENVSFSDMELELTKAQEFIRRIFLVFNWNSVTEQYIEKVQQDYLNKRKF